MYGCVPFCLHLRCKWCLSLGQFSVIVLDSRRDLSILSRLSTLKLTSSFLKTNMGKKRARDSGVIVTDKVTNVFGFVAFVYIAHIVSQCCLLDYKV